MCSQRFSIAYVSELVRGRNMNIYILPALVALLIKIGVLVVAHRSEKHSPAFMKLVLVFALHNLCEVLLFIEFFLAGNNDLTLRAYYVSSVWGLVFVLLYGMEVAAFKLPAIRTAALSAATLLSVVILGSGYIVAGSHAIGYVFTATKGPFYFLFQAYSMAAMMAVFGILIYGYRRARSHMAEIQCLSTVASFLPLILLSVLIMTLMNLGFEINATAILPIATSAFLCILLLTESHHRLTDIRRFLPGSPERRTSNEIMEIFSRYSRDDMEYRAAVSEIEKMLVLHKYQKNDRNASATAQLMGMPRSSLYSIFNRLKIEDK
jgi:hypothetical protein